MATCFSRCDGCVSRWWCTVWLPVLVAVMAVSLGGGVWLPFSVLVVVMAVSLGGGVWLPVLVGGMAMTPGGGVWLPVLVGVMAVSLCGDGGGVCAPLHPPPSSSGSSSSWPSPYRTQPKTDKTYETCVRYIKL